MRKTLISFLLLLFVVKGLLASTDYAVERISPSKDFPISEVNKIWFGNKGLLWIATDNGLYFYDGYSYDALRSLFFDLNTLSDDNVLNVTQDSFGDIWLLTGYGIERFSVKSRLPQSVCRIQNSLEYTDINYLETNGKILLGSKKRLLSVDVNTKLIDTLYVSAQDQLSNVKINEGELFFLDGTSVVTYNTKNAALSVVELADLNSTAIVAGFWNNSAIIAHNNSLLRYNLVDSSLVKLEDLDGRIMRVSAIRGDVFLASTFNKTYSISLSEQTKITTNELYLFKEANVKDLVIDLNGFPWIATSKNILKLNPYSNAFVYRPTLGRQNANGLKKHVYDANHRGLVYLNEKLKYVYYDAVVGENHQLPIANCIAINSADSFLYIGDGERFLQYNLISRQYRMLKDNVEVLQIRLINNAIWAATDKGVFVLQNNELNKVCDHYTQDILLSNKKLFILSEEGFGEINESNCEFDLQIPDKSFGDKKLINDILYSFDGNLWVATDNGLFLFSADSALSVEEQFEMVYSGAVYSIIEAENLPEIWYATDIGVGGVNYRTGKKLFFSNDDGVSYMPFSRGGAFKHKDGTLEFTSERLSLLFNPDSVYRRELKPRVFISRLIYHNQNTQVVKLLFASDTIEIEPQTRYFELELSTFDYFSPESNIYEYSLQLLGEKKVWKVVQNKNKLSVGRLAAGKYDLFIRAINSHGLQSDTERRITLIVKAPIAQTKGAYFTYLVTLVALIFLLIRLRTRNLTRINNEYKEKEIIAQKIERQKEELSVQNKNITDSINYARRIQLAMMPSQKLFSSIFSDSFVLHMPKDIVSGDFYWVNKVDDKVFFSAVDCTGHGVPGAFMSIIGVELFRRITEVEKTSTPAEVLNSLSRNFERVFGEIDEMKLRDGMDLAFCSLNEDFTVLEYAGAFNPLYIVRDSSILEIKGDRYSVGVYEEDDIVRSFNNHVIPVKDGDTIYIFTDGFADQFGGPEGKKYKYRRFRHLLLALHQLPMDKQREFLRKNIQEWKGDLEQVDDIMVMGIRIHHKK